MVFVDRIFRNGKNHYSNFSEHINEVRGTNMKNIICFVALMGLTACANFTGPESDQRRVGAICKDGTRSSATGVGACSWHGGVRTWIYA